MAEVVVPANDPTAVTIFSTRSFAHAIRGTTLAKIMAAELRERSQTAPIQLMAEPLQGPGDVVKYNLYPNPIGPGIVGDAPVTGQEVSFSWLQQSLTINQHRQSILLAGRMSQQRVPHSLRELAMVGLANWAKQLMNWNLLNQLAGNTNQNGTPQYVGFNTATAAASANNIIAASRANEASLQAGDVMLLDYIVSAVAKAQGSTVFPIKPIVLKGMEVAGILLMTAQQVRDLKLNFNAGEWGNIFGMALQGGQITGNPLFVGAIGMYNNVPMHQDTYLPWGNSSQNQWMLPNLTMAGNPGVLGTTSVGRALFIGAQAGAVAFGGSEGPDGTPMLVKWVEELVDAQNKLRITVGWIWGALATIFNSVDYGRVVISTWNAP